MVFIGKIMIKKLGFFFLLFGLCHFTASAQSLRPLLDSEQTLVFMHRGALYPDFPENSMVGLHLAKEAGFTMLEIDIRESKDGVLYLLHDKTLDRTTHGEGSIADWESGELDKLGIKGTQETLPRFDSFLEAARENEIYLMLDVKNAALDKVMALVAEKNMLNRVVLLTFQLDRAEEAFGLDQRFLVSVLINEEEEFDEYLCKSSDAYHVAVYLNKDAHLSLYEKAGALGLPIITDVLGSIDEQAIKEPSIYREFIEKRRPCVVVTDHPKILNHTIN
jgi:glycerophosphoryl diester phosphodiesterase